MATAESMVLVLDDAVATVLSVSWQGLFVKSCFYMQRICEGLKELGKVGDVPRPRATAGTEAKLSENKVKTAGRRSIVHFSDVQTCSGPISSRSFNTRLDCTSITSLNS